MGLPALTRRGAPPRPTIATIPTVSRLALGVVYDHVWPHSVCALPIVDLVGLRRREIEPLVLSVFDPSCPSLNPAVS
jgi:hypothetical protein